MGAAEGEAWGRQGVKHEGSGGRQRSKRTAGRPRRRPAQGTPAPVQGSRVLGKRSARSPSAMTRLERRLASSVLRGQAAGTGQRGASEE